MIALQQWEIAIRQCAWSRTKLGEINNIVLEKVRKKLKAINVWQLPGLQPIPCFL